MTYQPPGYADPLRRSHLIADQEAALPRAEQAAEHLRAIHEILEELKHAIDAADPNIKYEQLTLDPNVENILRYEGRYRYALFTTDTAGTKINIQLWSGFQFQIATTAPGWVSLDLPAGSKLFSGDANRHVVIARMSNLKV